jgi:hypothetical protein
MRTASGIALCRNTSAFPPNSTRWRKPIMKTSRWRSSTLSSKRGVRVSSWLTAGRTPCRKFVPHRATPCAATILLELEKTGNDKRRPPATKRRAKAAAHRHLCGSYDPGCHRAGLRGVTCRSALDGTCARLAIEAVHPRSLYRSYENGSDSPSNPYAPTRTLTIE